MPNVRINGNVFEVIPSKGYRDLTIPFEPKPDTQYWLVQVSYTTGDSNGRSDGTCIEYVGIFQKQETALENAKRIREHHVRYVERVDYEWHFHCVQDDGSEFKLGTPWSGYFESDQKLEVKTIYLAKAKDYFAWEFSWRTWSECD